MRDSIFISYSHLDNKKPSYLNELQTMLKTYESMGTIDAWADTRLKPGAKWRDEIDQALNNAKAAVLLVSTNFLASDFIAHHELPPLLEAAKKDGLTVFWVCLDNCAYEITEIESYQAVHDTAKSLGDLSPNRRKSVWKKLCQALVDVPPLPPLVNIVESGFGVSRLALTGKASFASPTPTDAGADSANCVINPDLRKKAQDLIVVILQPSDAATRRLAARFGLDGGQIVECRLRVAEKIPNTPLGELFEIALEEQQGLDGDGKNVMARLVQAILPFLQVSEDAEVDALAIRTGRATVPNTLYELHASHKTFAELIMAKANRRPTAYLRPRNPNEFPASDACLPRPPEGGRDPDGLQFKKDFTEELAQRVEPLIDDEFKDKFTRYLRGRFTDPTNPPGNEDALLYWINDGLRRDANRRKRQYLPVRCDFNYYYLVEILPGLDEASRAAQDAVLLDLQRRFSNNILFLRLAPPDPSLLELRPYSQLIDLLCT